MSVKEYSGSSNDADGLINKTKLPARCKVKQTERKKIFSLTI